MTNQPPFYPFFVNLQIINFYMQLINARSQSDNNLPGVYAFSTFFVEKIRRYGGDDKSLMRWAGKINRNLLEANYVIMPVHYWITTPKGKNNKDQVEKGHWVLVVRI